MSAPDLLYAFGLPPEKAVEYFRSKGYQFSWDWHDMLGEAHAKAFTVAKAMRTDVLEDIRGMAQKALDTGITLEQFKKELTPKLQAKGWWGRKMVGDETGASEVQLGSPRRLKTIYQTNMQTALNAGRYSEFMDNVDDRPYWQYVAIMDSRTRPAHAALNGKVFRYDDPIWKALYPPNGWGCRCRVRALSAKNLKDRGLTVSESGKDLRWFDRYIETSGEKGGFIDRAAVYRDPVTGTKVIPDPGWSYNPGQSWAKWDARGRLPDCLDVVDFSEDKANCLNIRKALKGQKTYKDFGRPDLRDIPQSMRLPAPELLPLGKTREEALNIMLNALGLSVADPLKVIKTPIEEVALRMELVTHFIENAGDIRESLANYIIPTLVSPYEIYLTEYTDGFRRRYIGLFEGAYNMLYVVRLNKDGSLLWNVMEARDKRMNKQRIGQLLWAK